jgi:hypothetical protein
MAFMAMLDEHRSNAGFKEGDSRLFVGVDSRNHGTRDDRDNRRLDAYDAERHGKTTHGTTTFCVGQRPGEKEYEDGARTATWRETVFPGEADYSVIRQVAWRSVAGPCAGFSYQIVISWPSGRSTVDGYTRSPDTPSAEIVIGSLHVRP